MAKTLPILASLAVLVFAGAAAADPPKGWVLAGDRPAEYDTGLEARGAGKAAFVRGKPAADRQHFGTLMQSAEANPYRGKRLRLSASLKTDAAFRAQMWMRVDGRSGPLAFDNMNDRPVKGSADWKRYEVVLDVPDDAVAIAYGFFLMGPGKVSADEFKLEVVGPDVAVTGSFKPRNLSFEESRAGDDESLAS